MTTEKLREVKIVHSFFRLVIKDHLQYLTAELFIIQGKVGPKVQLKDIRIAMFSEVGHIPPLGLRKLCLFLLLRKIVQSYEYEDDGVIRPILKRNWKTRSIGFGKVIGKKL